MIQDPRPLVLYPSIAARSHTPTPAAYHPHHVFATPTLPLPILRVSAIPKKNTPHTHTHKQTAQPPPVSLIGVAVQSLMTTKFRNRAGVLTKTRVVAPGGRVRFYHITSPKVWLNATVRHARKLTDLSKFLIFFVYDFFSNYCYVHGCVVFAIGFRRLFKMNTAQQYCLRWNNHRTNLLRVFDELLQNEAFTDVTIVCDGGNQIKCHKMVLAACSPYFQDLFTSIPCKHPIVVLKDVKYVEIKAILEYMYRGEVNVAQNQLAALLKVAEALKVKGLVEENRSKDLKEEVPMEEAPCPMPTSPCHAQNVVHSSSSNNSPPHSTNSSYKSPYGNVYPKNTSNERPNVNLPLWAVSGLPIAPPPPCDASPTGHPTGPSPPSVMNSYEVGNSEMYPHRRKKFSSMMLNKDTPILRTVLGQGQVDSSQPVSLVCHRPPRDDVSEPESYKNHMKNEPLEDAQSPYTDFQVVNEEDVKPKMAIPSSSPQSFSSDMRNVSSGIANYVPTQKPEWKRYKQYTRNDIMSAIDAVRNGMSALQAARKYGVPSRTLYDKVKKLGITTSRPFKRGANGSSSCFSYMIGGSAGSPYHMSENEEPPMNNNTALMEASNFLQHALDNRGDDALTAMAVAAAAHAAASQHSTSPSNHGHASSPSPSPTLLKYMHHQRMSPQSPSNASDNHMSETNGSSERDRDYDDDQVEDLSIGRKQEGVIMPPMNQISTIMKNDDVMLKEMKEDTRREMTAEERA
ncbi:hypothetical protein WA026_009386 [Henosepilachna vigintioctopunctata]|uniref:Uncharacterized protein n=1 Tax=Henosepilachna vigintioctopunctata TaxID=420089 RepID=A0AAW1U4L3_9CUCU